MAGIKRGYTQSQSYGPYKRRRTSKKSSKSGGLRRTLAKGGNGTQPLKYAPFSGRYLTSGIGPTDTPFPASLTTRLNYAETGLNVTSSSGGFSGAYSFGLNNLFDPNETGVGHQPRYYDTMCGAVGGTAPYQQYCVYAAKWALRVYSHDSLIGQAHVGTCTSTSANLPTSLRELMERTDCQCKMISPTAGYPAVVEFSGYVDMAKFFGMTKQAYLDDNDNWTDYNADPDTLVLVSGFAQNDHSATTKVFTMDVAITYYACFRKKNDVAES